MCESQKRRAARIGARMPSEGPVETEASVPEEKETPSTGPETEADPTPEAAPEPAPETRVTVSSMGLHRGSRGSKKARTPALHLIMKVVFFGGCVALIAVLATQLSTSRNDTKIKTASSEDLRDALQTSSNTLVQETPEATAVAPGSGAVADASTPAQTEVVSEPMALPDLYTFKIVKELDRDHDAFTQGFLYTQNCVDSICSDAFYESTGLHGEFSRRPSLRAPFSRSPAHRACFSACSRSQGETSVRLADLATGRVEKKTDAARKHFGEGLTRWKDKLIQLTWQVPTVLVYSADDLRLLEESATDLRDGWGLTNDTTSLIATDSGNTLYFLDPETLRTTRAVDVTDGGKPVRYLNELEYVDGEVWANIWQRDCVARIDPATGRLKGWIIASDLTFAERRKNNNLGRLYSMDVLNGIAYDPDTKRIWFTGKKWSTVYQVEIVPSVDSMSVERARKMCIV